MTILEKILKVKRAEVAASRRLPVIVSLNRDTITANRNALASASGAVG